MENTSSMDDISTKVPSRNFIPIPPTTVEETQLDFSFLADLALKSVYADANCSTTRMAQQLVRPTVIDFVDLAVHGGELGLRLEELLVTENSELKGQRLLDSGISGANGF